MFGVVVEKADSVVRSGSCLRISTGASVPRGADAVVQVEDTELVKSSDDGKTELEIKVLKEVAVGQDIRLTTHILYHLK